MVNANDLVIQVVKALKTMGIEYMVVGSYSSNVYGIPRATHDADMVLELGDRLIGPIVNILGPEFHLDPQMSFETVTATYRYILQHAKSGFKIELFMLSDDEHDKQRFAKRKTVEFHGESLSIPQAEDVVITKLRWSKIANRPKDKQDVLNILAVQGKALDLTYIREWTQKHGTREVFEKLWVEAEKLGA